MTNLYDAANQWATRPADERFWTVRELLTAARADKAALREAGAPARALTAAWDDEHPGELYLLGPSGQPARLTYAGADRLCRLVGAPASYLRGLPAELAAKNLAVGLARRDEGETKLLLHTSEQGLQLRDVSSERYERIYAADVAERLCRMEEQGWRVPPARPAHVSPDGGALDPRARRATAEDVVACAHANLGIKVGDWVAPAGLYYGYSADSTLFAFMVDDTRVVDAGGGRQLYRGFFVDSPELSGNALKITWFLFDSVCGNHIVWGVERTVKVRVRHVGSAEDRAWAQLALVARQYGEGSGSTTEAQIRRARATLVADTKDQVIDKLFGLDLLTRKVLQKGYELAEKNTDAYGDPRSYWGMVCGLTEAAQEQGFIEARTAVDKAAGKVLEMAF